MKIYNRPTKNFHIMPNQRNLTETKLTLKERGLLSVILEFAGIPNWEINLTHLAHECDCSVATVQKIIRSLIKKGWLTRERVYSPQGMQGSFCKYEVNYKPEKDIKTSVQDSKHKIVGEYFNDSNFNPETQGQKNCGHNNTDSNKTYSNNTDTNNTLSNKNVINLEREINSKIKKLIWQTVDEYEDFQNQFLIHKAKMLNKLPGEVAGIFLAMEKRINNGNPSISDLTALKQWRSGFLKETNFISKQDTQSGFNSFTHDSSYSQKDICDFLETAEQVKHQATNSTPQQPVKSYSLNEDTIKSIITEAIAKGEIICERLNSDNVRGVQIDNFTFEELEQWLQKHNKGVS